MLQQGLRNKGGKAVKSKTSKKEVKNFKLLLTKNRRLGGFYLFPFAVFKLLISIAFISLASDISFGKLSTL